MKKVSLLLAVSLLSSTLSAGVNYGLSSAKVLDGESNGGFQFSVHNLMKLKKVKGLGLGFGAGMDYFTLGEVKSLDDDAGMLVNANLLLGYSFENYNAPVNILAGIGYGGGQIGAMSYTGLNYQVATEYDFTEKYGVGIKYKHNNVNLVVGEGSDLDIVSVYFKVK